jgi:hypothetical protein
MVQLQSVSTAALSLVRTGPDWSGPRAVMQASCRLGDNDECTRDASLDFTSSSEYILWRETKYEVDSFVY